MNGTFCVGNEDPDSEERYLLFNATEHLMHPAYIHELLVGDM